MECGRGMARRSIQFDTEGEAVAQRSQSRSEAKLMGWVEMKKPMAVGHRLSQGEIFFGGGGWFS